MAKTSTLLAEVRTHLPRKGQLPWFKTTDRALQAELDAIKADFHAGKLGPSVTKTGLSTALSLTLCQRGVEIGPRGVQQWLDKNR